MIVRYFLLFLLCFYPFAESNAQATARMLPIKLEGKWGFISINGQTVVEPRFVFARGFSEGLAAVWEEKAEGRKCGYLNTEGVVFITTRFDDCGQFREGLALVKSKDRFGFIDKDGNTVIAPEWEMAGDFAGGLARIATGKFDSLKYGFINRKGKVVIAPRFSFAGDFRDGLALAAVSVQKAGLRIGFINVAGKWAIKPQYSTATSFSEGFACVAKEGSAYLFERTIAFDPRGKAYEGFYINAAGKKVFGKSFQQCGEFSDGFAPVQLEERWSYITQQGRIAFTTNFGSSAEANAFSEGLAAINFSGGAKFISVDGTIAIDTDFDYAQEFQGGVAQVKNVSLDGAESIGYIDRQGKLIWKPSR